MLEDRDELVERMKRMTAWAPDRGKRRMEAQITALQMLSDLLKNTDMRLGQVIHALAFVDGISREFCHVSDEGIAKELTRLRVALLGEVTIDWDESIQRMEQYEKEGAKDE